MSEISSERLGDTGVQREERRAEAKRKGERAQSAGTGRAGLEGGGRPAGSGADTWVMPTWDTWPHFKTKGVTWKIYEERQL